MSSVTPPIMRPSPFRMKGVKDAEEPRSSLRRDFGFAMGAPREDTDEDAARARILSHPTNLGLENYTPEPKTAPEMIPGGMAGRTSLAGPVSIPNFGAVDSFNEGVGARNQERIASTSARDAEISAARDAQEALRNQFGTTDPKLVQYQMELDRKASLAQGFEADIADIRQQHLEMANAAQTQAERTKIDAYFDREYQNRLARYTVDLGQNVPGQAYAPLKPQPFDYESEASVKPGQNP